MRFVSVLLGVVLCCAINSGVSAAKPKVVVEITISQFYPEWLDMYSSELGVGGFKRLLRDSKMLNSDYGYMFTQSGVDQATIATGTYPGEHGVVSHSWYDRVKRKQVPSYANNTPVNLNRLTLASYMRMANSFSRTYSVAMDVEAAIMAGGAYANNIFWFNDTTGKIVGSDFHSVQPQWLEGLNRKINSDSLIKVGWMPLDHSGQFKNNMVNKVSARLTSDFFYDLAQLQKDYKSYMVLKATPFANDIVTDLAVSLMKNERIGQDNETDLIMITLSSLDYMNRDFSVTSKEFKDLVIRMDKNLEKLFTELDIRCGTENYTLLLTMSEARELLPVDLAQYSFPGNYFSIYRAVALLRSYLKLMYGDGDWITTYDSGQIYLNRMLIQQKKIALQEIQRVVADFLIDFEGVSKVVTSCELATSSVNYGDEGLLKSSFYPKRSGDVLFSLQYSWVPILQDREDRYNRYSKRHIVPLYLYGNGTADIKAKDCKMVDILPTMCDIIGMSRPYGISGNSLRN